MEGEETKNWKFHHLGLIVADMEKTADYLKSLGFSGFPAKIEKPTAPTHWLERTTYGKTVIKDGQRLIPQEPGEKPARVVFCQLGSIAFEVIEPGDGVWANVNNDFLEANGEGISHIGYTVNSEHFDQEVDKMKAKGLEIILSGRFTNGGQAIYFDTRKVGGIIIELMGLSQ